jgi:glycosyltransferase involved in cell wall biosynthesis
MAVTILVPTYNMGEYLGSLAASIAGAGMLPMLAEILFVDDGSVDATPQILEELARDPRFEGKLRVLRLEPNRGRFAARFEGAQIAKGEWILFLDSRLTVMEGFALNLQRVLKRGAATVGWVETDVTKNIYCLYWQRSHETVFRRHYRLTQPLELNVQNYDLYLKGTGVFVCKTEHFLDVCRALEGMNVKSDDTLLLREMLELGPLYIDPALKVDWEPRSNLKEFLFRFFERGPGFVEYHVFKKPRFYALAVFIGLFAVAVWFGFGLRHPLAALAIALLMMPFIALSALPFGKTWKESFKLMPLHALVILFFGSGVLYGLAVNMAKSFNLRAPARP